LEEAAAKVCWKGFVLASLLTPPAAPVNVNTIGGTPPEVADCLEECFGGFPPVLLVDPWHWRSLALAAWAAVFGIGDFLAFAGEAEAAPPKYPTKRPSSPLSSDPDSESPDF
jgi:hypothetical protein